MPRSGQSVMAPVRYEVAPLGGGVSQNGVSYPGGLDLLTPTLRMRPGTCRAMSNFECAQSGGYSRIVGYERLDGRASPSAATYTIVQVASFVNVPSVSQVVTQATSGATGTIVAVSLDQPILSVAIDSNGNLLYDELGNLLYVETADVPPYLVLTATSGMFDFTHTLTTPGPVTVGTATTPTVVISPQNAAIYTAAAADYYRALIGAVPGSGAVLGVVGAIFGGVDYVYAFRANVGATAVNIYKASATGWTLVPFLDIVSWTAGGGTPADGDTLTQGGVTATIKRVMWQSGSLTGNTAVGQFVITTPTGGNFAAGAATTSSGGTATLAGAQTAITLTTGGRFQFVRANFSGQTATARIYGCDGANKCFEFDGTTLAPITTGLSPDQPSYLAYHHSYLIVAQGGSISGCGAGTPFKWLATDGGWEIATGSTITGILTLPGSQTTATLGVYADNNTSFLYGTDPTTFNLVTFNTGLGAQPYSVQNLFDTFVYDMLGVVTLRTTLNWGNFLPTSLTKNLLPFIIQQRDKITASTVYRTKAQYRVFFNDGSGLWLTMANQDYLGAAVVNFPNPVNCVDTTINSLAQEVSYFGSNDGLGYVYQLEAGTSFDGANLNASITTAWDAVQTPRILKRFRAASLEVQGGGYADISFGYQLGYGSALVGQPLPESVVTAFTSAAAWDQFTWDQFTWDGQTTTPTDVDVTGTAENVQAVLACGTNYIPAFTLNSVIWHFSLRRGLRV